MTAQGTSKPTAPGTAEPRQRFRAFWLRVRMLLIGLLFVAGTTLILLLPSIISRRATDLAVGDIATEDIRAPRDLVYVSQIQTQAARDEAAAAVEDIFTDPDPRIGRQQVRLIRQIMTFMQDVRADSYADEALKQQYLDAINELELEPEATLLLVNATAGQFDLVNHETVTLIEEAMGGTVREGYVEEITDQLELRVSTDLPEELIPLTVEMASRLIVPNSILNVTETEAARESASGGIPVIEHSFRRGEVVVRAGERIDELDFEALVEFGLTTSRMTWEDVASALLVSLMSGFLLSVYLVTFNPEWLDNPGWMLLLLVVFLIFAVVAQFMVPNQPNLAYLFPAAALSLALSALIGVEFSALTTIVLAIIVGYLADAPFELATFTTITGLFAAGSLRRTTRLNAFFLSGLAAAVGGVAVLLIFELPMHADTAQLATLILLTIMNGLLSAGIALVLLFVIGSITGITTSLRLIDLSRPDHALQKRLQQEALGTYQHSLAVASIAEAAAEAIGADSLLTRVGAQYHDIGKANNPGFFIENRTEVGRNPHDDISPMASARIIRAHVTDGLEMARKHRLPPRVIDFIAEHHGTMAIQFFLHKAREEAREAGIALDESQFYYGGPAPRSRETAILMMADCCESAARANRPANGAEVEQLVTRLIQQRLDANQFDDSGLTLTDIKVVKDSIVRTLKGMYHPRIRYPEDRKMAAQLPASQPGELPAGAAQNEEPTDILVKPTPPATAEGGEAAKEAAPVITADDTKPGKTTDRDKAS